MDGEITQCKLSYASIRWTAKSSAWTSTQDTPAVTKHHKICTAREALVAASTEKQTYRMAGSLGRSRRRYIAQVLQRQSCVEGKGSANDPQNVDACAICLEPLATDLLPLLVQA